MILFIFIFLKSCSIFFLKYCIQIFYKVLIIFIGSILRFEVLLCQKITIVFWETFVIPILSIVHLQYHIVPLYFLNSSMKFHNAKSWRCRSMIDISIFENLEVGVKDQVCIYWVIYWLKILWDGCNFLFNLNNYKINDLLQDELNESEYYDLFQ